METNPASPEQAGIARPQPWTQQAVAGGIIEVSPDKIQSDPVLGNLRTHKVQEEDEDLEASIRVEGLLQPIGVRRIPGIDPSALFLVFGGRRLDAVRRAGIERVLVRDLGPIDDLTALVLQIVENDQRATVHPLDDARAIAHLVRRAGSQAEAARRTGRSEATISILRRIGEVVEQLDPEELRLLYASPAITVRALHAAVRPTLSGREATPEIIRRRLLETARTAEARAPGRPRGKTSRRQRMEVQKFERGGGVRFTVRWTDRDLATDPESFIRELTHFLDARLREIAERAASLRESKRRTATQRTPTRRASSRRALMKMTFSRPTAEPTRPTDRPNDSSPASRPDDVALFERVDALIRDAEKRLEEFRARWKEWEKGRPRRGL